MKDEVDVTPHQISVCVAVELWMEDLESFVEKFRTRRRRMVVAAFASPLVGLLMVALSWFEFYRAGNVLLGGSVAAPDLPLLQIINVYIMGMIGGALVLVVPLLVFVDIKLWRQSDIVVRLWDRVADLERRLPAVPDEPRPSAGD
ncbi:MAG: hypothetical protein AAFX76_14240 [Planctomycetota bacterium]